MAPGPANLFRDCRRLRGSGGDEDGGRVGDGRPPTPRAWQHLARVSAVAPFLLIYKLCVWWSETSRVGPVFNASTASEAWLPRGL